MRSHTDHVEAMTKTRFSLEVHPVIPAALSRLPELAGDLAYSWNRGTRMLFANLDHDLWHRCGHNPRVFLRRVGQDRLDAAATSLVFLQDYKGVLADFDTYQGKAPDHELADLIDIHSDLIAYFCFEYGLHESFPVYSGGLGILAGDHCKAASDLGLPFVAVGLLYRAGYVDQIIDGHGNQQLRNRSIDFADLPITPVIDGHGAPVDVAVELPGRRVMARLWQATIGHIRIVLLDTDVEANRAEDRTITHQLYGGDTHTRIQQEIILGIGGVRALRALGLGPTIWHINEGHAAFLILERIREQVALGIEFDAALEWVAAATVFTTHTPVAAGHDIFDRGIMLEYFRGYIPGLGLDEATFMRLGSSPSNEQGFNQTALALRGSRFHNGVSRIHGGTAARTESFVWSQVPPDENPMDYITNGVHVPTFLAAAWVNLFDLRFGSQWRNELRNPDYWSRLDDIPDATFWSVRQLLKYDLLREVRDRYAAQLGRIGCSQAEVHRLTRHLVTEQDVCIFGFARRFATYKRATLPFLDPARLARALGNPERPGMIIFAGKAHPRDLPGQALIRAIHEHAHRPEFEGRIILLEGYDLALARRLVTGVDVWLNVPEYPLEASGTSGMKAGINGVLNVSILDGWWGEGYRDDNGWAIAPHCGDSASGSRDRLEAGDLLEIMEDEVLPLYYRRNQHGYPAGWVRMAKQAMRSIIPRFNSQRMLSDYTRKFYSRASRQQAAFAADHAALARELAQWKRQVRRHWPQVSARIVERPAERITIGGSVRIACAVRLGELRPDDIAVELLLGTQTTEDGFVPSTAHRLVPGQRIDHGETLYEIALNPPHSGLHRYEIRLYPHHPRLTHRFETGLMLWI